MSDDTLSGKAIRGISRASHRYAAGRICKSDDCDTKLSTYNKRDYCHVHAPVKFPRVRGRIVPEGT
jgi:hypothetical protein